MASVSGWRVHPADELSVSACEYGGPGMSKMSYSEMEEPRLSSLEDAKWSDKRKKVGLSRFPKPQEKSEPTQEDKMHQMVTFIREKFHQKECRKFVPKQNQRVQKIKDLKCQCGEILRSHDSLKTLNKDKKNMSLSESIIVPQEYANMVGNEFGPPPKEIVEIPWNPKDDLHTSSTSSFGKISFNVEQVGGRKPSKYVRVSDEDSVLTVLDLMKKHWRIMEPKPPNLVISVVGGAKNFRLDGRMRETFSSGLIKAAKTTSAWLITSGFNMGVMKAVGQAVHEGQTFLWNDQSMTHLLRCIGIAPWGYIRGRHTLESEDNKGKFNASYRSSNVILHGKPVPLNSDHTHFIFVDDGYRNRYGGVADFRAKFEKMVSLPKKDNGLGIPVVLVVVEGGTDALQDAKRSLDEGTPVVVCAGTGRAADILAYAYKHTTKKGERRVLKKKYKKKLVEFIYESYGKYWKDDKRDEETQKYLDIVEECCLKEDLMVIFHMNKHEDLDLAILSVLLKAKTEGHGNETRFEQLKLALTWNRADIAQREIFREDVNWRQGSLDDIMTKALIDDKVDFIKLLLNHGVVMKEYLTVKNLENLYSDIQHTYHLHKLLKRETGQDRFNLLQIGKFLTSLLDKFDDEKFNSKKKEGFFFKYKYSIPSISATISQNKGTDEEENEGFECPYKQLLIWSVLMNRPQMSVFFWEMGQEPITSAIAATRLCGAMVNKLPKYEHDLREAFEKSKQLFEELAIKVLDECHAEDPDKSMLLVERKSPTWSKMTCLQMAASAKDQAFLSSVGCQYSINNTWKQGILSSWRRVVVAVVFPWLVCSRFMELSPMGEKKIRWHQQLQIFYTAPMTKFTLYTMSYLGFLILYSYMVLVDYQQIASVTEWICFVWILTFLVGEIHAFLAFPSPTVYGKIRDWYGFLNRLDLCNLMLFIVAFGLRWVPSLVFTSKTIYCVNAVVFYLRIMNVYTANKSLGPKLVMILKMFEELVMFCLVLGVFLLAYGVSSQGLLYLSRAERGLNVLIDVVYYPYWQLYGEIFLEELETDTVCMANVTDAMSFSNTCRTYNLLVPVLLAGYLLVGNVLLLNLLIAIFSHVFDTVEKKSLEIWKYQMYFLVSEYDVKTGIIPPFSIIAHAFLIIKWFLRKTCWAKTKEGVQYRPHHLMYLQLFEKEMMANYLRRKKAEEMNSIDMKFNSLQKRVDDLTKLIEDEMVAGDESDDEYNLLETQETIIKEVPSVPENISKWPAVEDVVELGKQEKQLDDLLASEKELEEQLAEEKKTGKVRSPKFELQETKDVAMEEIKKKHKKKKKKKDKKKEKDDVIQEENIFTEELDKKLSLDKNILSFNVQPASPRNSKNLSSPITKVPILSPTRTLGLALSDSEDDVPRDKLGRRVSSKIKSRASFLEFMDSDSESDNILSNRSNKGKLGKRKRQDKKYDEKLLDMEDRLDRMARTNQEQFLTLKTLLEDKETNK